MFSPLNASFIEFMTVCYLVLITSYNLNPNFFLNSQDSDVLQSIIIFTSKSSRKNFLFNCF